MITEQKQISKSAIIAALSMSVHGKLDAYIDTFAPALLDDFAFVGHLIAWNRSRGQIKDAKVAVPVLAVARWPRPDQPDCDEAARLQLENALAHLAMLDPRLLVRALDFGRSLTTNTHKAAKVQEPLVNQRMVRRLVTRYLRNLEKQPPRWEAVVLQHRRSLKTLYARYHVKSEYGAALLTNDFGGMHVPRLAVLSRIPAASPQEAAGLIAEHKIPFLTARGVMGVRMKDPDVLLALIGRMTATDVVTNMKTLERWGVKTIPALRAALEEALTRVGESTKAATLKTSAAADVIEDEQLREKLLAAQEKQLDRQKGIEGDWLVLADKSGSMKVGIDKGVQVAGILARMVRGRVHLMFFDRMARHVDATGKSYEELQAIAKSIRADGGTAIGCGVLLAAEKGLHVDGIAIVSDGGEESRPDFVSAYDAYVRKLTVEPSVYFYQVGNLESDVLSRNLAVRGLPHTTFDVRKVDYYSLPDLVKTMRVGHYGLVDEIWSTPLVTLDDVLSRTVGMAVIAGPRS